MSEGVVIRHLAPREARSSIAALSDVLIDCVEGGASVSFMHPMTREKAARFWQSVADDVARGQRVLIVAEEPDGRVVGTVQLVFAGPENQPHRADVAKMLVRRDARGRGIAQRLMESAEATALQEERTLLVLDTVSGSTAERLYLRAGWQRVGEIPDYALMPDGALVPTTVFFKSLGAHTRR